MLYVIWIYEFYFDGCLSGSQPVGALPQSDSKEFIKIFINFLSWRKSNIRYALVFVLAVILAMTISALAEDSGSDLAANSLRQENTSGLY
jgi:hypothetical protein